MVTRTYKKGDVWSASDANAVLQGVEQLLGYYELPNVPRVSDIKFGKANGDIIPDTITGSVIVWDDTANPPAVVSPTEQIDDVHYVWLSDEQVSDGKEVAIVKLGEFWHLLFAECEDPEEKQTGN